MHATGGRPYSPPAISNGGASRQQEAGDRQQEAAEAAGGIVFGRDDADEVQADPIARDTATLERMEAAADSQARVQIAECCLL